MSYGHWAIDPSIGEFDPDNFFGFIYEIEEVDTGRLYIGRKQFRLKGRKDSKWREYTSSSKELQELVKTRGKEYFNFKILSLCSGKSQLTYEEESLQYTRNVLMEKFPDGTRKYFNKTIGHRHFAGVEKQTEETKKKLSDKNPHKGVPKQVGPGMRGKKQSPEHTRKIREAQLGKPKASRGRKKTDDHKEKLSQSLRGKPHTDERRKNQSDAAKHRPRGSCTVCRKEFDINNLKQWHGDKCRLLRK